MRLLPRYLCSDCRDRNEPVPAPPPREPSEPPANPAMLLDPQSARRRGFPGAPAPTEKSVPPRTKWSDESTRAPAQLVQDRTSNRWISWILLATMATFGWLGYRLFCDRTVYGLVVGHVIRIPAPWPGTVASIQVREGDELRAGQLVGMMENLQIQHQLQQVADELNIQRATLDAEIADIKLRSQLHGDRYHKALAEFYELWGTYLEETAEMEALQARLERIDALQDRRVVAAESIEALQLELQGQRVKVEKLRVAVDQLRTRAEKSQREASSDEVQLKPIIARIESLQEQLKRLRQEARRGEIRAAVSGRVVQIHRHPGEHLDAGQCLLEILAEGSLRPTLYVPDHRQVDLADGALEVEVLASGERLVCDVRRWSDRYEAMPSAITPWHRLDSRCLPVELLPHDLRRAAEVLRLGGVVRLRPSWQGTWRWLVERCTAAWAGQPPEDRFADRASAGVP